VREGANAGAFLMIECGRASLTRDERCIADLGPGQFFGEVALLGGGPRTASVVAATEMRVRVVPQREFAKAMQKLPTLARCVRAAATDRIAALPPRLAVAA
jgi:CRP/FNR family transcriptional regulator, cyclic AMP receptor protein